MNPYNKITESLLKIKSSKEIKEYSDKLQTLDIKSVKKVDGTFNNAIQNALKLSLKHKTSFYIYNGNSYGVSVFRITYKKSDAFNPINNMGNFVIEIKPNKKYIKHEISR
jgi:hypothetical protein